MRVPTAPLITVAIEPLPEPRQYRATFTTRKGHHACAFQFDLDDFYDFLARRGITPSPEVVVALDAPWSPTATAP